MTDAAPKPEKKNPIPILEPGPDYEMNTNGQDSSKVMMIGMIVILAVAGIGGVIAIAPQVRDAGAQKQKIEVLEAELAAAKAQQQNSSPSQTQLSDIQQKMNVLADQAKQFGAAVTNGDVQTKLSQLEGKFDQVIAQSHMTGLSSMLARVQSLQQSPEGMKVLEGIVGSLAGASGEADIGQHFENLRATDPGVAQITEGVAPEDMKAAAMLIAMAQMRKALLRGNDSFDEDLALLKKTLPADDPALAAAIDRLAPQAKYGVLTPDGLSQELRGMTGDIVSASLTGQDVSIKEKAKARLADVLLVEKNGHQISGTESQIAIAAAQQELDAGNVQSAIDILKTLQGPAAQQTQPFLQQAEATVMAGNVQGLISQNIVQNVKSGVKTLMNGGMPSGVVNPYGVPAMTNKIKSLAPGIAPPVQGQ